MDQTQIAKLEELCRELHGLSGKIETISGEIGKKFVGVGSEYCAACLEEVTKEYRQLEKRLESAKTAMKG